MSPTKNGSSIVYWFLIVLLIVLPCAILSQSKANFAKFNINRISTYIYNNGITDINPNGNGGFEFPKGSQLQANYCGGFIWGGKVNGVLKVGGSNYQSGLSAGKILPNGKAEDPESVNSRVFRVRSDYKSADLNMEAEDEGRTILDIYDQYEKDWMQWPASNGAPFQDVNNNGIYEPSIDIPGVPGANQTLWFVANDLDSSKTNSVYGSQSIGIEMQVTVWGYKYDGTYRGDALFKRHIIINKSTHTINDMFLGIWADPDVGDAGEDLAGCDSTLNMSYMFSSTNRDGMYGSFSPAFGFSLLQGPMVNGQPSDKAIFKNKIISGKKNLKMSSLGWIFKGGDWGDPQFGKQNTAQELYYFLQGKSKKGSSWPIPTQFGGGTTKFPYSGNYVKKTGYYDGVEYNPSDRRMMLCVGPFNMAAGDTQEVVFMESAAGADRIANNLEAIDLLKENVLSAKSNYSNEFKQYINPNALNVKVINHDKRIILNWGESSDQIKNIEKDKYEVQFQGYIVYQFPDSSYNKNYAKTIAVYDKRDDLLKFQSLNFDNLRSSNPSTSFLITNNAGIKRYQLIGYDKLSDVNLANWREYYFGVSYFSSTTRGNTNYYYETDFTKCKGYPSQSSDGINYSVVPGQTISLSHTVGTNSDFQFILFAVDPSKFGNYTYEITFKKVNNELKLNLKNITTGKDVFINELISYPDQYPIFDGMALEIWSYGPSSKPLTESDVYRFSTKASTYEQALVNDDIKNINVFPNPYYGLVKMDTQNHDKFVTFTHLPQKAIIRIFNLSGQLVRIIEKDSPAKTTTWNFSNNDGWLVAGGLYVVQIELPDLGKRKNLKLIIVPSTSVQPFF